MGPPALSTLNSGIFFLRVVAMKLHNYKGARIRVPSAMKVAAWRHYLSDYHDPNLVEFIEFGWPVNYVGGAPLVATENNHTSSLQYQQDIGLLCQDGITSPRAGRAIPAPTSALFPHQPSHDAAETGRETSSGHYGPLMAERSGSERQHSHE